MKKEDEYLPSSEEVRRICERAYALVRNTQAFGRRSPEQLAARLREENIRLLRTVEPYTDDEGRQRARRSTLAHLRELEGAELCLH